MKSVSVPTEVRQLLADLRTHLREKIEPPVYVSDRRLVKAVGLMQVTKPSPPPPPPLLFLLLRHFLLVHALTLCVHALPLLLFALALLADMLVRLRGPAGSLCSPISWCKGCK